MRVLLLPLVFVLSALAQPPVVPEIRGTVFEFGTKIPIAGAEVTISEFAPNAQNFVVNTLVASTVTDASGAFSLKPGHLGQFTVGTKKAGYGIASQAGPTTESAGRMLAITAADPVQTITMTMTRPGTLTGRVIDRDGNPVQNLRVQLENAEPFPNFATAVTNAEGIFTASNLSPRGYIIHIVPTPPAQNKDKAEDLTEFTEDAFKILDEDVESSYWPGGLPSAEHVLPITVTGGAIANAGTITVRKISYYRVRVSINGDCAPNERWTLRIRPNDDTVVPTPDLYSACRKDFLLTHVPPGSYNMGVWQGRKVDRWALAEFTVTNKNTQTILNFNTTGSVSGRITAADGTGLAKLGKVQVLLRPSNFVSGDYDADYDANGKFTLERVPWKSQLLSITPANPDTYVKEIWHNGLPLRSQELETSAGSTLDIVLDSGAASLSVNFKPGAATATAPAPGRFLLISTSLPQPPRSLSSSPPFIFQGSSSMHNIPPGEYRILVPTSRLNEDFTDANLIALQLAQAEVIKFSKGEQKSIELQIK